jgi:hypothetical protein
MNETRVKAAKKAILVRGDQQAAVVAKALTAIAPLNARYEIVHIDPAWDAPFDAPPAAALHLDQVANDDAAPSTAHGRSVRFPQLRFETLWPFTRINEQNRPEPPDYPYGRFPYRDVFISTCVRQNLPVEEILSLYAASDWSADAWPDLDAIFERERQRLEQLDSQCDVRMGEYVLSHFRTERLFIAPQSPTNVLLAELIRNILSVAFPRAAWPSRVDLPKILSTLSDRDVLGAFAVPIHKRVAEHFGLTWYDRNDVYNHFDRQQMRDVEYYRALIAAAPQENA